MFALCLDPEDNAEAETETSTAGVGFAGYELLEIIGSGATGVVYRARQVSLNRIVALKMLRPTRLLTPEDLRRFRIETEAIARLSHPNIVPIFESGEERGQPYYSTRLIEGGSLAQRLGTGAYRGMTAGSDARSAALRRREAAELLREAAQAIQHAHDRGVLHRDLKPGNILIDADGHPQIVDFGLARLLDAGGELTLADGMLGTPAYIAPEQAQATPRSASPAADVYSLGAVMYEMLAGRPPFLAETAVATVHRIVHDEPVAPCVIDPRIPIDLQTICLKCLEKEPRRRYGSARELADDLGRWLEAEPILARPQKAPEKAIRWVRRNPLPASMGLLALFLLLLTVSVLIRHARLTTEAHRSVSAANRELEAALDRLTLQKIDDRLHQGESVEAVALLARVLRENPSNRVAASRMAGWLSNRSVPLHVGRAARHEGRVLSAKFNPKGDRFVTASEDGSACVWDARTGLPVSARFLHPKGLSWAEFSPDGRYVLSSCSDGAAYLWDLDSGRLRGRLPGVQGTSLSPGETGHVVLARFSPDGARIVTAGVEGTVRVWAAGSPEEPAVTMHHAGPVLTAVFSPDSRWLLTGSSDRSARLWDASTGEPSTDRLRNHGDVACVAFSANGTRFVTASFNGTARIWWTRTGLAAAEPLTHGKGIRYAEFSPDGRRVLTSSIDSTARVWDVDTGVPLTEPLRHDSTVRVGHFSPDGSLVLTASDDTTVRVWDIVSQQPICEPLRHGGYVVDASFSPDGSHVLTASADRTARVWRIRKEGVRPAIDAGGAVRIATFSPTGRRVATGRIDGVARVWDVASRAPVTPRLACREVIHDLAFSPDETQVAAASADHATRLWEVPTGRLLHVIPGHGDAQCLAFSPDGRKLARGLYSGRAQVFSVATGIAIGPELVHGASVNGIAFSVDGMRVATASLDHTARFWSSESGAPVGAIMRHQGWVHRGEFSQDGRHFLTASADGTARVWDAGSGAERLVLRHGAVVLDATYDPSSRWIATRTADRTVRIWSGTTGQPLGEPMKHPSPVVGIRFGAHGGTLLTGARDGRARLWDTSTGLPLTDWILAGSQLNDARLDPSGRRLLLASQEGVVRFWEAPNPPLPVPDWLPVVAEALVGARFDRSGILVPTDPDLFAATQERISGLPHDSYRAWFEAAFSDSPTESVTPSQE